MNKAVRGFTLIELLVVISIISLLSSIVLSVLSDARTRSRDAKRIETLIQIQRALELYYHDNNQYPARNNISSTAATPCGASNAWCNLETDLASHIAQLPRGETGINWYYDANSGDGYKTYGLAVIFESPTFLLKASGDGGYVSTQYEVGQQPQYCQNTYSGVNRNWLYTTTNVCRGGN